MEFTPALEEGRLLRRYKRFLADIERPDGEVMTVHCPNTGAMTGCNEPGSRVWLSRSDNPKRKYPYTWELVETAPDTLVCVNTGRANALAEEAVTQGVIESLAGYERIRREVRYGSENSRIDLLLERGDASCFIEVKNVTLGAGEGLGLFPDAVSARGSKHLRELMAMRAAGQRAVLLFCVAHTGIERVRPADAIDPRYGATLREALAAGVEVLAYRAQITPQQMRLCEPLPVECP